MAIVPFAEWVPDASDFGSPGSITIQNVLPGRNSYKPFKSLTTISDALDARPRGAVESFDINEDNYLYAGDAAKLYELNLVNAAWTDRSKSGGYTTADGEMWDFTRWENKVLATNFSDNPQQITMGAANFSDLTTAFRARTIATVGDFVVAGNTFDSSDGNRPNRIRWSALGDETDWTVSTSTLSDFRDIPTGGAVRWITGGDVGIIISESSVFRMSFVGAPVVFQIDEILPDIGTNFPESVVRLGEAVYFISDRGFVELTGNGTGVNFIGSGRVDQFFLDDIDERFPSRISAVADPRGDNIAWLYPGAGNTDGVPNRILLYNRTFQRWVRVEQEAELLLRVRGIDLTLDELDQLGFTNIDTMEDSFDSEAFVGGSNQISAFDTDNKVGIFRGTNKTATLETNERESHPGRMTQVNAFRPVVDGGTVTGRIGFRDRQSDTVQYTASLTQSATGRFTTRKKARYHRFELTITGSWNDAIGVQLEPEEVRQGGRRG